MLNQNQKRTMNHMSNDEKSLLLYLETCAVDYCGRVNSLRLSCADETIIRNWERTGFIEYGRIIMEHVNSQGANWVVLSDDAVSIAHYLRKERLERGKKNRRYVTTKEKKAG